MYTYTLICKSSKVVIFQFERKVLLVVIPNVVCKVAKCKGNPVQDFFFAGFERSATPIRDKQTFHFCFIYAVWSLPF